MSERIRIEVVYTITDHAKLTEAAQRLDFSGDFEPEDDDLGMGAVMTLIESIGLDRITEQYGVRIEEYGVET